MKKEKRKKSSYFGYHFFLSIIIPIGYLIFGGKIEGKDNILKKEGFVFAGNHVGNYDAYLLCNATKRPLHFVAKKELFSNFITRWFFNTMHLIPVDRSKKNPEAKKEAINLLNEDEIICIFPEGTYHKDDILLPFKKGAVDFAIKSHKKIIPFAIIGEYKFRSNPKLIIGKPIDVSKMDIITANNHLENVIRQMIVNNLQKN